MSGPAAPRVLIVADGDGVAAGIAAVLASVPERPFTIAADGGAAQALAAGLAPDLVIGDRDSLGPEAAALLAARGIPIERAPVMKDESDTELCIAAARARGARWIRLVGALGGPRVEHAVANLGLLALPALDGVDVAIVAPPSTIRRAGRTDGPGSLALAGAPGDHVSLLPLAGPVAGVTTDGLLYPLRDEPLLPGPARGLSNALVGTGATVHVGRGVLLVIQTPADPRSQEAHP